jgi:hypothetical protein
MPRGRPKKPADQVRDVTVRFRLTEDEHRAMRSAAARAGLGIGQYARWRSLNTCIGCGRAVDRAPVEIWPTTANPDGIYFLCEGCHADADRVSRLAAHLARRYAGTYILWNDGPLEDVTPELLARYLREGGSGLFTGGSAGR